MLSFTGLSFALMGFTPVSARIVTNYTLEIAPQEKHPQYLGVMSLFPGDPAVRFASDWSVNRGIRL